MKRSTNLLARLLIGLVAIAFIVYVTLDTIFLHVFFTTESAVVGVVYMLIVIIAMFLLLFVQQRGKRMESSGVPPKEHTDKVPPYSMVKCTLTTPSDALPKPLRSYFKPSLPYDGFLRNKSTRDI